MLNKCHSQQEKKPRFAGMVLNKTLVLGDFIIHYFFVYLFVVSSMVNALNVFPVEMFVFTLNGIKFMWAHFVRLIFFDSNVNLCSLFKIPLCLYLSNIINMFGKGLTLMVRFCPHIFLATELPIQICIGLQ